MKFFQTELKNGLTIIGEQRPTAVSSALGFFVRTGARDETPEIAGVSHFLEHMMFKGTEKRTALDINYQLGALGAQANAYTSEEKTVYYTGILPEYFPEGLELFSDMLRPKLDPTEFDTEKKVILEEIALYLDRPHHIIFEAALQAHFQGHPAGNSVLGTLQSVGAVTRDQMKTYFDARYTPANIVLVGSGNFDWNHMVELAEKYCSHWTGGRPPRDNRPHSPTSSETVLKKDNMQRAHLCMLAPGPSMTDESRFAAQVLSVILGDSSGSKVFWELVDKGLVDSASIDGEEMDGTGIVIAYASVSPENIDVVEGKLRGILADAANFTDAELARAITKIGTRLVLQGESSMRRLMSVGVDYLERGEYLDIETELKLVRAVTRKSINTLLERFPIQPTTTVRLLPEK
ncbi:MAG: pitrilysin family protein [Bdellovibrionota bacterium]